MKKEPVHKNREWKEHMDRISQETQPTGVNDLEGPQRMPSWRFHQRMGHRLSNQEHWLLFWKT